MCRLFGLSAGKEPVRATFWLLDAPDSLRTQSHREPDGTGLGWFDHDGKPRVRKQALAAFEDRAFATEAQAVRSTTFVSHIRFASTGELKQRNTHPFEQQGRLFAHNGVVQDLPALEARIGPEGMALVGGETDSERLFALISTEIEQHGGDVIAGITAAIGWVAGNLPLLALNFVLIADGELWALRYPETHDLFVLERPAGGTATGAAALDQRSSHGTRVQSDHGAERETLVIASERMDDDPGWRELRSGELLHVDPSLTVRSLMIAEQPPAHPLSLSDLEGHARASQQG